MTEITKCLKEWNIIVEALGQGKQTILIRKYDASLNEFLLYPTTPYINKVDLLVGSFQDNEFAMNNLTPWGVTSANRTYEVKYYAIVEDVIDIPQNSIDAFNKFHIWTTKHVQNYYLGGYEAKIWILRVYKLDNGCMRQCSNGLIYDDVYEPVKLKGKPVLSDAEFGKLKEAILTI